MNKPKKSARASCRSALIVALSALAMLIAPSWAGAEEPVIREDLDRFDIAYRVQLIANPTTAETARQHHLDELAELVTARHRHLPDIVLIINWIFDEYRYRCRNAIVQSVISRLNEIDILRTQHGVKLTCDNRSRDQGIRTIVQIDKGVQR